MSEQEFMQRVKRKLKNLERHPENLKYAKRDRDFIAYFVYLIFRGVENK